MQQRAYKLSRFIILAIVVETVLFGLSALLYKFGERWITGLKFDNKDLFILMPLGILLLFIFIFHTRWKNKALSRFAELKLLEQFSDTKSKTKHFSRYWYLRLSWFFLVLALVNPKIGSRLAEGETKGMDIIFCLDVSTSMLAEDLSPNRLSKAKRLIDKVLEELNGDRIGLVVFAGEAFVQLPLTTDYSAAKLFLSTLSPEVIPTQGTAIGAAIDLAFESFDFESQAGKAIVAITDGENHEDDAAYSAKYAADNGIKVFAVGMGTVSGAPIPTQRGRQDFKKDNNGNVVVSKLDASLIESIADNGNGLAIYASNSQQATAALIDELANMEKGELDTVMYQEYEDRFQWFLIIGLLLLAIDSFTSSKQNRWLNRVILFGHA